jgi:alpha-ketoglutarate-dependent taurine dioxygenase
MVDAFADSVRAAQRSAPRFRLAAGEALLIDNLRVSHGREGFEDLNRLLWRVRICKTASLCPTF